MHTNLKLAEPKTFEAPVEHSFRLNEEINEYIERMTRLGMKFKGRETENQSKNGSDWVVVHVNFQKK